ncbi:Holliday junction branch migration protein RuvA [Persephonella sp.]|uniref:Holliday junction branch migration protein RuvA n=1 Tax=Persephonella sp. TaxID=2060922 RepID=UPI0025F06922|nr:Holliday junction branch migration protein RuvA [Persephonella sp.]
MLEYIKGRVISKGEDHIILERGGFGFRVLTPSVFDEKDEVKVFTRISIKEDEIIVYGFRTVEERDLFDKLLTVSGVGVKHAFSILKRYSVGELLKIIEEGDVEALTDVQGVGKKTAQRIILELKGKLDFVSLEIIDDIVDALVNLGFEKKSSVKAAREAVRESSDLQTALKKALQKLSEKG